MCHGILLTALPTLVCTYVNGKNDFLLDPSKKLLFDQIICLGHNIDICLFWSGSEDELISFHQYLNNINPNIKLTMEYSKDNIN